jgi:hypothetical protein
MANLHDAAAAAVALPFPVNQKLLERLSEQHVGTYPKDAGAQFLVRAGVVEQDQRIGWAPLGGEVAADL